MSESHDKYLAEELHRTAITVKDPADRSIEIIDEQEAAKLARKSGLTLRQIHIEALRFNIWPYRYIRNRSICSTGDQLKLAESSVAVIGSGGLGGTVIALLARSGIGFLTIVDSDHFDETNLNRQLVSNIDNLGKSKAREAARMVSRINPAVEVKEHAVRIDTQNAMAILSGTDVLVDALDNIPDRFVLEEAARRHGIPMIHGALAGFNGQVMTIFPDDPGLALLYGGDEHPRDDPRRAEAVLGVPALTPSAVATIQAMETVKVILGRKQLLRKQMLHIDLEAGIYEVLKF